MILEEIKTKDYSYKITTDETYLTVHGVKYLMTPLLKSNLRSKDSKEVLEALKIMREHIKSCLDELL